VEEEKKSEVDREVEEEKKNEDTDDIE